MPASSPGRSTRPQEEWQAFAARSRALPFEEHLRRFREIHGERGPEDPPAPAWYPDAERIARANLTSLMSRVGLASYPELHAWSVQEREAFWTTVIEGLGIQYLTPPQRILDPASNSEHPVWLPGARLNIAASCLQGDPARPAIIAGEEAQSVITLGELRDQAYRCAATLRALGLQPGDGVAFYLPMTVECVAAYLGTILAGGHVISIAESFSAAELERRLAIAPARLLVTCAGFRRGGRSIDLYGKVRAAGSPRALLAPGAPEARPTLRPGDLHWEDLPAGDPSLEPHAAGPEEVTNVLFSSGTTATPKAIPWTHLTPLKCAMDGRYHQDLHAGDVIAWPTSIGWMMGPWLIHATLLGGATMAIYPDAPTGAGFCRFVERARVTMLGVIPSLVRAWRSSDATRGCDWSRVQVFSSTGEPSSHEDYLWLMSRTGYAAPVIEYCGGTEIGGGYVTGTVLQPACPTTFTTPALGLDLLILDEAGRQVPPGETGELFLVPPSIGLSQRLLNADHHAIYHVGCPPSPRGGLLRRHGDALQRLPGDCYRAAGRADDTMNLGGIKVGSVELEAVVETHRAVYECAAISVQPGGEGIERLVLFVVPHGNPEPTSLQAELQDRLAKDLNPLFRIHDMVLVEALPRTASGKLMRRQLRTGYPHPD